MQVVRAAHPAHFTQRAEAGQLGYRGNGVTLPYTLAVLVHLHVTSVEMHAILSQTHHTQPVLGGSGGASAGQSL
jgi:hypothetical protein